MSRVPTIRKVRSCSPKYTTFKPSGKRTTKTTTIEMSIDELKALCLMDCENLYQQEAAERMGVSRQTFGNILASARRKCTQMLVKGLTLVIEGGNVCSCDCEDDEKPCYCRRNSEQETVERSGEES